MAVDPVVKSGGRAMSRAEARARTLALGADAKDSWRDERELPPADPAARHDAALARLVRAASELIAGKLDDAHAHATKALTDALKATPDGRATIARVRRSPSYAAALVRLDELGAALVMLCGDAREAEYRRAYAEWGESLPAEVLRPRLDPANPPIALVARCSALVWHGTTLQAEFRGQTDPIKRRLLAALTLAGGRAATPRGGADLLRGWRTAAEGALLRTAAAALNDSLVLADRLAGRDVIDPTRLHPDPTLPE
jgi:hypothetical protein